MKNIWRLIPGILLFTAGTLNSQGTWERMDVPTLQNLNSVCFTDSLYGWIGGDSGVIMHTINGGKTWEHQNTHAVYDVKDVFFLNRDLGWASTFNFANLPYGTIMLHTADGGANWTSQPYVTDNIFINCILFRDSLNGWMGGSPHALVRTTDGGATWTQAAIAPGTLASFPVLSIAFYNDTWGYASGGMFDIAGVTWHTSNGGELWYVIDPSEAPADEVHGLHLFDSLHVMGAGGDPDFGYGVGMIRTSDGGQSWTYDELTIQGNAYDLDFRNDHEVWAPLGPRRKLIYSMDAGNSWTDINSPGLSAVYDMIFPDSLHGFAVGKEGAAFKYVPAIVPFTPALAAPESGYTLHQNNPNPVLSGTTISFSVRETWGSGGSGTSVSTAELLVKVTDIYGREVACIAADTPAAGEHSVNFATAGLPAGTYIYALYRPEPGGCVLIAFPKRMIIME